MDTPDGPADTSDIDTTEPIDTVDDNGFDARQEETSDTVGSDSAAVEIEEDLVAPPEEENKTGGCSSVPGGVGDTTGALALLLAGLAVLNAVLTRLFRIVPAPRGPDASKHITLDLFLPYSQPPTKTWSATTGSSRIAPDTARPCRIRRPGAKTPGGRQGSRPGPGAARDPPAITIS